jgi:hypothetical protein
MLHSSTIVYLDSRREWLALRPGRFTHRKIAPGTHRRVIIVSYAMFWTVQQNYAKFELISDKSFCVFMETAFGRVCGHGCNHMKCLLESRWFVIYDIETSLGLCSF